jgi:hypothetical protein
MTMPVIINEFEIVAQPPEPPKKQSAGPLPAEEQGAGPQPLRPIDIVRIQEHHQRRMARLEAD